MLCLKKNSFQYSQQKMKKNCFAKKYRQTDILIKAGRIQVLYKEFYLK